MSAAALEQRRHDRVGLLEELGDDGLAPAQLGEHVRVLRALARVEERDLAGAAAAAVDAAGAQRRPGRRGCPPAAPAAPAPPSPPGRGRRRSRSRSARARAAPRARAASGRGGVPGAPPPARSRSALASPASSLGAEHERAAQRRLRRRARRAARLARSGAELDAGTATDGAIGRWSCRRSGHVLLHDDVEVGAAEAERADARDARRRSAATSQSRSSVLTANGDAVQSTFGLGRSKLRLGGSTLSCSASVGLEHARRARRALEVADVRLHRAERDRARRQRARRRRPPSGCSTSTTSPTLRRGAVALDQGALRGRQPGVPPGPLDREALADRVGGGDALALAVARARRRRGPRRRSGRRRGRRRRAA